MTKSGVLKWLVSMIMVSMMSTKGECWALLHPTECHCSYFLRQYYLKKKKNSSTLVPKNVKCRWCHFLTEAVAELTLRRLTDDGILQRQPFNIWLHISLLSFPVRFDPHLSISPQFWSLSHSHMSCPTSLLYSQPFPLRYKSQSVQWVRYSPRVGLLMI